MFKKSFAVSSCLCILLGCFSVSSSALGVLPDYSISQKTWNENWAKDGNVNTNACLTPGNNETELNFAWHSDFNAAAPFVTISKNSNMSNAKYFSGSWMKADGVLRTNKVTATGIEQNSVYYYTYGTGSLVFGPYLYRTLQADNLKFLYVNDVHAGFDANNIAIGRDKSYKIHTILNEAITKNPDISFVLAGGDNTDSGQTPEEWNGLLASPIFRNIPISFAIGNHDKKGVSQKYYINNPNEFDALLPSPVGTDNWFRFGDVLFLLFDSTNGSAADHLNFAMDAVNKNLDAKWRIGVLHNDINSPSFSFLTLDNNLIRTIYTTIFDRAGLDVLLNGHSHVYGRTHFLKGGKIVDLAFCKESTNPKGTAYISMSAVNNVQSKTLPWQNIWTAKRCRDDITSYSTFEVNGDSLKFKAFYAGGEQCDEYTITKTNFKSKPFVQPKLFDLYNIVKLGGMIYTVIDSAKQ